VLEILEAANVSASSFAARFPDENALLRALHARLFERVRDVMQAVVADPARVGLPVNEACRRLMRMFVAHRIRHRSRIRTFAQAEAQSPELTQRRHTLDAPMLGFAGDRFAQRLESEGRHFDRRDFTLGCDWIASSIDAAHSALSSGPSSLEAPRNAPRQVRQNTDELAAPR
jgi:AcrR family transcriptional regulator